MQLPKFLLGDNTDFPDDIFIVHTDYPQFIINLVNDEIEWLEDVTGENQEELTNEINDLIEQASVFYDREMERYQD
ncbi:hypothetical protein UMM65_15175 [Aureibaculum sp. 2210JD6-5]|uniref:hypothetical protein n=1 Tax=Aureibaculum sp. 2210JD6-5 TaxID=3103957 RepID=UPI002AACDB98|nr:hypothetical protein [Aureibaculum sp. 2210JD6-5]MDY7396592.1 hypothetical protein [Aureibaculum sp. 2210JD6-5]